MGQERDGSDRFGPASRKEKWVVVRNRFLASAVLAVLVVTLAACGGGASEGGGGEQGPTTVTIGTQPWIGYGPWYIAQEKGFDRDNNVRVELKNFSTDQDVNSGFASRRLDAVNAATHTTIKYQDAGLDFATVLIEDVSTTADAIVAPESVTSIEDLRGQRVAFEEGSTSDLLLSYALEQNGMSKDDIETVQLPAADVGNALLAGRVDIGVTYEPYLTAATSEDPNLDLLYTAEEEPGLISDVFVVRQDLVEEQPEVISNLLRTWDDAIRFYDENPEEAQRIIGENVGIDDPGELETTFAGVEFYDLQENKEQLQGPFQDTMSAIEETMKQQGQLEGDPDPLEALDTQFVEELGR